MTINNRSSPEDEFSAAKLIFSMKQAPLDGTPIVARDSKGRIAHIRWRIGGDLEPGEPSYWARWDTDEEFRPVSWARTTWTVTDILEVYG